MRCARGELAKGAYPAQISQTASKTLAVLTKLPAVFGKLPAEMPKLVADST
jgi:hypothetical protein